MLCRCSRSRSRRGRRERCVAAQVEALLFPSVLRRRELDDDVEWDVALVVLRQAPAEQVRVQDLSESTHRHTYKSDRHSLSQAASSRMRKKRERERTHLEVHEVRDHERRLALSLELDHERRQALVQSNSHRHVSPSCLSVQTTVECDVRGPSRRATRRRGVGS